MSTLLCLALAIFLLIAQPDLARCASGGRIGGGSFQAPSMPRAKSYGGYNGYQGTYRRSGIGFPFILPFFGFGGGGLFGFLIIFAISGVILNLVRGSFSSIENNSTKTNQGSINILQLQIALLSSKSNLQSDLQKLSKSVDTANKVGLQKTLQDITLLILRQPEQCVYANLEKGNVPFNSAESTFNKISLIERSKLKSEAISNFSGEVKITPPNKNTEDDKETKNNLGEYIVITILVASKKSTPEEKSISAEYLQETLRNLGSIPASDLTALEIIWQPENENESLYSEELLTMYPNLKYL